MYVVVEQTKDKEFMWVHGPFTHKETVKKLEKVKRDCPNHIWEVRVLSDDL